MALFKVSWMMTCRYLIIVVTCVGCGRSQTAPSCEYPITNASDVIFLLDVSNDISNRSFSDYKSLVWRMISENVREVNQTKRCACILFNEDNSAIKIDNLSRSNATDVTDFDDQIQKDLLPLTNSTHIGVIEATRLALSVVSTNQNTTRQVTIFYVTTGSFGNVTSPIANVTSLLATIEDVVVPGMLTVYGIGVDNYTQSGLEELVRAGNNTCRVKSLDEWKRQLFPSDTSKDSTGNGTDMSTSGSSDRTFSSLLAFFVIFNLTFVILLIALCIWAGKSRPELKIKLRRSSINGTEPLATIRVKSRPLPAAPSEETSLQTNGLNHVTLDNVDDLTNGPLSGPSRGESRDDLSCTPQTSPPSSKFNRRIPRGDKPVDDISRWLPTAPPKESASLPQSSPPANLKEMDFPGSISASSPESPAPSKFSPRIPRGDQPVDDINRWLPPRRPSKTEALPPRIRDPDEPYYVNVKPRNNSYLDAVRRDARSKLDKAKRISRRIMSVFAE